MRMSWVFATFAMMNSAALANGQDLRAVLINADPVIAERVDPSALVRPNVDLMLITPRLETHIGAYRDWLTLTCGLSAEQRRGVADACVGALTRTLNRFAELPVVDSEFDGSEFLSTPIMFCGVDSAAPSLFDSKLRREIDRILTPAQREVFQAEEKSRQLRVHQASVGRVLETIDDKLYLKLSQRDAIQEKLVAVEPQFTSALFSFQFNAHDFGCKLLGKQDFLPRSLLTPAQLAHLETMSEAFPDYGFQINGKYSDEQYLRILKKKADQDREGIRQYVQMQIDGLSENVDEQTQRYLQLSCEGAVERVTNDWYRSSLQQLFHDRGNREEKEHFWGQRMNTYMVDWDPFFKTSMSGKALEKAILAKNEAQDQMLKTYMVMLFDQELWLTSEQRKELEPYIKKQIDFIGNPVRPRGTFQLFHDDLREFGRTLHSIPDEKMNELLSEQQFEAWKQLKQYLSCTENMIGYRQRRDHCSLGYLWRPPSTEN